MQYPSNVKYIASLCRHVGEYPRMPKEYQVNSLFLHYIVFLQL